MMAERPKWVKSVMSSFDSAGWGFGASSGNAPAPKEKYPIKRFEPTLRKFVKVADIDLGRLEQHKINIEKLRAMGDVDGLRREHINATRTVQQLQAHMRQLEQTRLQVQDVDLPVFDKKIVGIQKKAFEAAETFLRSHHAVCAEFQGPGIPTITTTSDGAAEDTLLLGEERIQAQLTRHHQAEADAQTLESWQDLEKELTELNGVIHYFATMVTSQQEQVDRIEDNVEQAQTNVEEGVQELGAAAKWKSAVFPAVGALIGGAVGGPVGLVAGLKLGGLAAVGGGIIGITGGTLLKKRQERVAEMELQNLSKRNAKSLPDLPTKTPTDCEEKTIATTS